MTVSFMETENKKMVDSYVAFILKEDTMNAAKAIHQRIKEMTAAEFEGVLSHLYPVVKERAFQINITFPYPVDEQLLNPDR